MLLIATPAAAHADAGGDEAIRLGKIGLERFERADWEGALDAFADANAAFHSPVLVMYQARCLRNLGKLLEAKETYKTIVAEALPADAPAPWRSAHATSTSELAALLEEIPRIVVTLRDPQLESELLLDDTVITPEVTQLANPGAHVLSARGKHGTAKKPIVVLRGKEVQRFSIAPPAPAAAARSESALTGSAHLGIGLASAGGAALIASLVTGLFALDANADADALVATQCSTPTACPAFEVPAVQSALDRTQRLANATDGLLIAGSATVVVGLIVLLALPLEQQVIEVTSSGIVFQF